MDLPKELTDMCAMELCNKTGKHNSVLSNNHTRDKKRFLKRLIKDSELLDKLGFKMQITAK